MKKILILLLLTTLISSCYHEMYGQEMEYRYNLHLNKVMASSGLNIRSKPNLNSDILAKANFNDYLLILHKDHYGLDTLETIITQTNEYHSIGYWQKVQYGEIVGYVNNAFLYFDNFYIKQMSFNDDHVLLRPGSNCVPHIYNKHDFQWYGIYINGDSTAMKRIEVEFMSNRTSMLDFSVVTKQDRHLKFIIGSKNGFPPQESFSIRESKIYSPGELEYTPEREIEIQDDKFSYQDQEDGRIKRKVFSLTKDRESIQINPMESGYYPIMSATYWEGDFNGDGELDYIFSHGLEGDGLVLYLSNPTSIKEYLKAEGYYRFGICC